MIAIFRSTVKQFVSIVSLEVIKLNSRIKYVMSPTFISALSVVICNSKEDFVL